MVSQTDEWVLISASAGGAPALMAHLHSIGFDAFVASAPKPENDEISENLFPGHVFADAAVEGKQSGAERQFDGSIVTNRSNRPFAIPGPVASELKHPMTQSGRDLARSLLAVAPEYRLEQLMVTCARWQIAEQRKP